jgi:hypothetical protein
MFTVLFLSTKDWGIFSKRKVNTGLFKLSPTYFQIFAIIVFTETYGGGGWIPIQIG